MLIFDEPTKGVDIKAKQELFTLIDGLARDGKGIIYASGEFSELVGLCDRICVLWDGRVVAELNAAEIDEETLLLYSTGGTPA
ncbi:Ribose import ATP-binding protein RbsA [Serratia proteamaculans]|nr:Ribose import ATP-binding protein RbsA [Serratia proteamaculans]